MKKIIMMISALSFVFSSCQKTNTTPIIKEISVDAPFGSVNITYPDFAGCEVFSIKDFGAVAGDKEKTTAAISKAIEKANQTGAGIVQIPKGEWLTGKIHFKSNVNLHLDEGAVLLFSENPEDYLPSVKTTWEGMECYNYSPLIYAYECENIAITGKGELKAKMDTWQVWFARPSGHMNALKELYHWAAKGTPVEERQMVSDSAHMRPQFIQFNRCENVLLDGLTITNSPFWVIHPFISKNVVIRNVNVFAHGHNNDGVDPEMTENILIEDCIFDQGDDAIAIKSGRNQDAWRLNAPTKNLIIRNCLVKNGHQLMAIGSELSGGIENVFMENCQVVDGAKLNHLLFIKTNERRGGYVKNIYLKNIKSGKIDRGILGIETDVLYQWRNLVPTYERRLTKISDIYLDNIQSKDVKFISNIQGEKELPIENVFLNQVKAETVSEKEHTKQNVVNFNVTN